MRSVWIIGLAAALAGCGQGSDDPISDAAETAEAIEASEAPPPVKITPQIMTSSDFQQNEIFGAGCSFKSEAKKNEAIAMAMSDAGYLKLDNEVVRLSPDAGSSENPLGSRVKYDGLEYSFRLETKQAEAIQSVSETMDFPATLTISDAQDRVVFERDGVAQCGA